MRIEVRIDRIVLDGVGLTPSSSHEISHAIQTELAKLIAATPRSMWNQSRTVAYVRAQPLAPVPSRQLGRIAGQALHRVVLGARDGRRLTPRQTQSRSDTAACPALGTMIGGRP
jgi:hypothetical protein